VLALQKLHHVCLIQHLPSLARDVLHRPSQIDGVETKLRERIFVVLHS
jgi:hypothetical protein